MVVVRQIDFQANQLSRLYLQEAEVYVCMEDRESEKRKCVWREFQFVCVCVFEEGGIRRAPEGVLFLEPSPIWYLSTSSSSTAPYITHTLVYTRYQEYPLYFSFTLDSYKIQSPGGRLQHTSACCRTC